MTEVSFTNGFNGSSANESRDDQTAKDTANTQEKYDSEYSLKKPINHKFNASPLVLQNNTNETNIVSEIDESKTNLVH